MRREEQPRVRHSVTAIVGAVVLADVERSVEQAHQRGIEQRLQRTARRAARRQEVAVAAHQHRQAVALGGEYRLPETFEAPAHHEHGVEAGERGGDLRRVAAEETVGRRRSRDVAQEDVGVAAEEVDVPVEGLSEARGGLLLRRRLVRVEHGEVDARGEDAKQRRVILHRMRGDDRQPHAARPSNTSAKRRATALAL